jgi:hypothetical protein
VGTKLRLFNKLSYALGSGLVDLNSSTVKCMLISPIAKIRLDAVSALPYMDHQLNNTGDHPPGGVTVDSLIVTEEADGIYCTVEEVKFNSIIGEVKYALFYIPGATASYTDLPLFYLELDSSETKAGGYVRVLVQPYVYRLTLP